MSLRLRLLAAFAYVLLLIIVALEVPLALNLARRVDAEVKNNAASQAFIVAAGASGRMENTEALQRLAREAGADLGARVIIVDGEGVLRADSAGPGLLSTPYAGGDRREIRTALAGSSAQLERHSDTLGADALFTAVPVTSEGRVVGAVRVTQSVAEVDERVRRSVLALIAIGALALLLGLALAWFLAGTLSRPLRSLARTARRVEEGDLEARAEVTGPSEQREVALAFNDMTERLALVVAAQREFVANASHQLRTPLTGLRLRLESAAMKAGTPEVERELAAAEEEVERLTRLLTALLTLAREGQGPAPGRAVSLGEAAARAYERWSARAEQQGRSLTLGDGGEATACASEEDVAIVLDNLIENALHYSPPGTTVTVEWGEDGREAFVAVLDEGPGLAPGEEEALFERFTRGSAARGASSGTGLGLAIVQTLARRWRGRASIANRAEGGARAEVRLPVARGGDLPRAKPRLDEALTRGA
jgi:signal transduction histidine kinase